MTIQRRREKREMDYSSQNSEKFREQLHWKCSIFYVKVIKHKMLSFMMIITVEMHQCVEKGRKIGK